MAYYHASDTKYDHNPRLLGPKVKEFRAAGDNRCSKQPPSNVYLAHRVQAVDQNEFKSDAALIAKLGELASRPAEIRLTYISIGTNQPATLARIKELHSAADTQYGLLELIPM